MPPGPGPAGPGSPRRYPPPPRYDPDEFFPPKRNRLAIVSLVTGLIGMSLFAVGFGTIALVQTIRRRQRGKGMAISGIVLGLAWAAVSIVAVGVVLHARDAAVDSYAKPGQCFDEAEHDTESVLPCDRPHDGQVILTFELPKQAWPGDKEEERLGMEGCGQRIKARYGTRTPAEFGDVYALVPNQVTWRLGDRKVNCAISGVAGHKLTGPIAPPPSPLRALDELRPGACIAKPKDGAVATRVMKCAKPHGAQVTHRFDLPDSAYPGDEFVDGKASTGCEARWERMFPDPARAGTDQWYLAPSEESWNQGSRTVLCFVAGADGRALTHSVVPR